MLAPSWRQSSIAKVVDPSITLTSYEQVGIDYGNYVNNTLGVPMDAYFQNGNNPNYVALSGSPYLGTDSITPIPLPLEVSYSSPSCTTAPTWDYNWAGFG